jgi:hypothetical protein
MAEDKGKFPWRVGSKVGRTIYDASGELIGVMDTREFAAQVIKDQERLADYDRLTNNLDPPDLLIHWREDNRKLKALEVKLASAITEIQGWHDSTQASLSEKKAMNPQPSDFYDSILRMSARSAALEQVCAVLEQALGVLRA